MIAVYEVLSWLNAIDGASSLTDQERRLSRSVRVAGRSDASVRRIIDRLQNAGLGSGDPLENAEVALHCAAIEYEHGWFSRAARHAREAARTYRNDLHRRAVASWILGMAQWEIARNQRAYTNWDRARTIFNELQSFFQHSPNERGWYRDALRLMETDLATRPEEILTWLNRFEGSSLTESSRQLVDRVQGRIQRRIYPEVYPLLNDLQEINMWSTEIYERAEAFLECGLAAYQMGNMALAVALLKKAVVDLSPGIGNNHKQAVARCMLAAMGGLDKGDGNPATIGWRRCIEEFEQLRVQADRDNDQVKKKWYADHRAILQAALSERSPGGGSRRKGPRSPRPTQPGPNPTAPGPGPDPVPSGSSPMDAATHLEDTQPLEPLRPAYRAAQKPQDLYQNLCGLVGGQKDVADGLIEYERRQNPNASLSELIERAIERLLRDRR